MSARTQKMAERAPGLPRPTGAVCRPKATRRTAGGGPGSAMGAARPEPLASRGVRFEREHPGAVRRLVLGVKPFVVGGSRLPHLPEDLQPALTKAAQRHRVGLSFGPMGLVVGLRPCTASTAQIGPQVDRSAQRIVAGVTHFLPTASTRLDGEWSGSGIALQALGLLEHTTVVAEFSQQPGRQLFARAGKRAEERAVGMLRKRLVDPVAVFLELSIEALQQVGQAGGQQALRGDRGRRGGQLGCAAKDFQPVINGGRPPQFVRVQEAFPFARSGVLEFRRRGERKDEGPGRRGRPIIEGLQGRGVVFVQRLLELVDEPCAAQ